ncbi:hypothetical protein HK104_004440 [Borealophlyctis nickersoniae]|nr:hypothetical protein HK104_004440 [Borealophlyctis nickersoniae]
MTDSLVKLNVGGQRFLTTRETLTSQSAYFTALLGKDFKTPTMVDDHIFIDRDGELFAHILQYLRGGTYPILYDGVTGFDYPTYAKIKHEAMFYGIDALVKFIDERRYVKAVKRSHTICNASYFRGRAGKGYHDHIFSQLSPLTPSKEIFDMEGENIPIAGPKTR